MDEGEIKPHTNMDESQEDMDEMEDEGMGINIDDVEEAKEEQQDEQQQQEDGDDDDDDRNSRRDSKEETDESGASDSSSSSDSSDESDIHEDSARPQQEQQQIVTEDGHVLSEYEMMRLERIKRNREHMERLGLVKGNSKNAKSALLSAGVSEQTNLTKIKRRPRKPMDIEKRRLSSRSAKREISYAEKPIRGSGLDLGGSGGSGEPKSERKPKNESVKKVKQQKMDLNIYREFKRVKADRKENLKYTKRNLMLAEREHKHAKKKHERFARQQQSRLLHEKMMKEIAEEREQLGGYTAREIMDHLDKRKYDLMGAQNAYDNAKTLKEGEATLLHYRQEAELKMQMIDALDRFPLAIWEAQNTLDMMLIERLPIDPPLPRKSGRNNKRNNPVTPTKREPTLSPLAVKNIIADNENNNNKEKPDALPQDEAVAVVTKVKNVEQFNRVDDKCDMDPPGMMQGETVAAVVSNVGAFEGKHSTSTGNTTIKVATTATARAVAQLRWDDDKSVAIQEETVAEVISNKLNGVPVDPSSSLSLLLLAEVGTAKSNLFSSSGNAKIKVTVRVANSNALLPELLAEVGTAKSNLFSSSGNARIKVAVRVANSNALLPELLAEVGTAKSNLFSSSGNARIKVAVQVANSNALLPKHVANSSVPKEKNAEHSQDNDPESTKKQGRPKKDFHVRNVGGWISPHFSNSIDRNWLDKNVVHQTFDPSTFVPQVGDIVLYYPRGHQQFLKHYPDYLGAARAKNKSMSPLWVRASKERNKMIKEEPKVTKTWWTEEWISGIHGELGKWPLICRVERTHTEFPHDPNFKQKNVVKKDDGGVQITWDIQEEKKKPDKKNATKAISNKKGKKKIKSPLCLVTQLRPLTTILPPGWGQDRSCESLSLPPVFSAAICPNSKVGVFVLPFSWTFSMSQSLSIDDAIVLRKKEKLKGGIISRFSKDKETSFQLYEKLDELVALFSDIFASQKPFLSVLEDAFPLKSVPSDMYAIALTMTRCLQENSNMSDLKQAGAAVKNLHERSLEAQLKDIILSTLPTWKGIEVIVENKTTKRVSCWDLVMDSERRNITNAADEGQPNFLQAISELQELTTTQVEGPVSVLEEALRAKIECTCDEFIEENADVDFFFYPIRENDAPNYFCAVPLGMCLDRILRRLRLPQNNRGLCYYRSVDSLLSDLYDIGYNCALYNAPDSAIMKKALELLPAFKAEISRVVSSHQRQKESRKKADEERRKLVMLQCSAMRKNDADGNDRSKKKGRRRMEDSPFFGPFDGTIKKDWIGVIKRDETWRPPEISRDDNNGEESDYTNVQWVPQCGDEVFYNRTYHEIFVKGHYQSLRIDQCTLPELGSTGSEVDDEHQNKKWMRGKILWSRAAFPRQGSVMEDKENSCFDVHMSLLALGIQLQSANASVPVHEMFWRPCSVSSTQVMTPKGIKTREHEKKVNEKEAPGLSPACACCKLNLQSSFLRPAWLPLQAGRISDIENDDNLGTPQGVDSDRASSIERCLSMLKRRCMGDIPPDYVDPKFCLENVKRGVYPVSSIKSKLPAFDVFFQSTEARSNAAELIKRTRCCKSSRDSGMKVLARSHYLPPWASEDSEFNGQPPKKQKHNIFSPHPKLCLEMIQLRLRYGYYRRIDSLVHDIQEAYISSVILAFTISQPIPQKGRPGISLKKLARSYLTEHVKPDLVDVSGKKRPTFNIQTPKKAKTKKIVLKPNEEAYKLTIDRVRKLYATALACVLDTRVFERVFGLSPRPKAILKAPIIPSIHSEEEEEKLFIKNKITELVIATRKDPCNARIRPYHMTHILPQVKIKVSCNGVFVLPDISIAQEAAGTQNNGAISGAPSPSTVMNVYIKEYDNDPSLAQTLFGRKNMMNACLKCEVYKRNMSYCRVVKSHSNPDFNLRKFFLDMKYKGTLGIDQMILKLNPESHLGPLVSANLKENRLNLTQKETAPMVDTDPPVATVQIKENLSSQPKAGKDKRSPSDIFNIADSALNMARIQFEGARIESERPLRMSKEFIRSFFLPDEDGHYFFCYVCGLIGDVLCCDSCPNVGHANCVNLLSIPEDDWFCEECVASKKNREDKGEQEGDEEVHEEVHEETSSKNTRFGDTSTAVEEGEGLDKPLEDILDDLRALRELSIRPQFNNASNGATNSSETNVETSCKPRLIIEVGTRMTKEFGNMGVFQGAILKLPSKDSNFYSVKYDDGDEEDMSLTELADLLHPAKGNDVDPTDRSGGITKVPSTTIGKERGRPAKRLGRPVGSKNIVKSRKEEARPAKKRGRPPKRSNPDDVEHEAQGVAKPIKRRGRPPKKQKRTNLRELDTETPSVVTPAKRRGRPPKRSNAGFGEQGTAKKCGIPPKRSIRRNGRSRTATDRLTL